MLRSTFRFWASLGLLAGFVSCKTSQPTATLPPIQTPNWLQEIQTSAVLSQSHTGFALYDIARKEMVAQHQAERYFTPASNTKLFSFYAGLRTLGDSIPTLRYVQRGDSLLCWGTGDPSLLNANLPSIRVLDFLRGRSGKIFLSTANFNDTPYGAGWQWDDYNGYYQAEVSPLPIYGNVFTFSATEAGHLRVSPSYAWRFAQPNLSAAGRFVVQRDFHENVFRYAPLRIRAGYAQEVPFRTSGALTAALLSDTLRKAVTLLDVPFRSGEGVKTLYSVPADTLYKRMLQPSDNTLAEHLMLLVSSRIGHDLSVAKGIQHSIDNYLNDLPDEPLWFDGSGLSRYNLFTPRSIVKLLLKIHDIVPESRLFELLAIGGKAGTLRNVYKAEKPFVFAKTGTVSNCHSLSGYLVTKSSKVLAFSFMHNNFAKTTAEIRNEMERILTKIHQEY
jgi:serine-type D-Ala-D-Ala carboxypeptidase/endopeptidase (penicillin-binding protein 4)